MAAYNNADAAGENRRNGNSDNGDDTPGGEITLTFANASETTIDIEYSSDVSIAGYQFEITGSGVAFETGTAMGAIAGHLSLLFVVTRPFYAPPEADQLCR